MRWKKAILSGRSSDSDSSVSSLSDEGVPEASNNLQDVTEAPPGTELQELQHAISSYLSNLYRISVLIRKNPAPHDRLIKSAKIDTSHYEFFDERHVLEKFRSANSALIERLGKANSKRRKYFKYREQHRQKLSRQQPHDPFISAEQVNRESVPKGIGELPLSGGGKKVPSEVQVPSVAQPSATKESTKASTLLIPSNAPLNLRDLDEQSDDGTQTSYGSISSTGQDKLALPPIPLSSEGRREFECPYCFTICYLRASDSMKREKEWKRHVLRDLQPYICTFGGCSKADTLFERRRDWINHELQFHRTEWYCNAPGHQAYDSQETFQAHMKDKHHDSFDARQLDSLTRMVARPAMDLKFSCPLRCSDCFQELDVVKLEAHLGRHLEVIASFALPSSVAEGHTPDGSIVTQNAIQNDISDSETTGSVKGDDAIGDLDTTLSDQGNLTDADQTAEFEQLYFSDLIEFEKSVSNCSWPPQFSILSLFSRPIQSQNDRSSRGLTDGAPITIQEVVEDALLEIGLDTAAWKVGTKVQIPVATFFQRFTECARLVISKRPGNWKDDRLNATMRQLLQVLITRVIREIDSNDANETHARLLRRLTTFRSKLSIPLPSEVVKDSDQDWTFLRAETDLSVPVEPRTQAQKTPREEICKWLAIVDQCKLLATLEASRHPGTAEWIFSFPNSDEIHRQPLGYAYHFFQGRSTVNVGSEQVIQCILAKLLQQAHEVPVALQELYEGRQEGSAVIPLDKILEILQITFSLFKETVIILDGLDICSNSTIKTFSRIVQEALKRGSEVRCIATSRVSLIVQDAIRPEQFERPTVSRLQWHNNFEATLIPRELIERDIEAMVASINRDLWPLHTLTPIETIVSESNGMFSWASTRLGQLSMHLSREENRFLSIEIPRNIEELWAEILGCIRIQAKSKDMVTIVDILAVLCVCERPLTAGEVDDYLSYSAHSSTWGKYRFSDQFSVWRKIPALLELVGQPGKKGRSGGTTDNLGLIHPSLRDTLQSDAIRKGPLNMFSMDMDKAQEDIAERCVSYLLRYKRSDSYTSKQGWTAYAGIYWHRHVKKLGSNASKDLTERCIHLLDHRTPSFAHWTYMTRRDGHIDKDEAGDFGEQDVYPSPLYYAALLGLYECAGTMLQSSTKSQVVARINLPGGKYQYPILAAVAAGEVELVKLLAHYEADINTALLEAAKFGQTLILEDLLSFGADVLYRGKYMKTAVHWAAYTNHLECLRILTDWGADLNLHDATGRTPLHLATSHGNLDCMKFLLDKGADLEAVDSSFSSPLIHAAEAGNLEALKFLIGMGAKVDVQTVDAGMTALRFALMRLNEPMVMALLAAGANTNQRTSQSWWSTPLHVTFFMTEDPRETRRSIVEALLQHDADPRITNREGRRAEDLASDPELKALLRSWRAKYADDFSHDGDHDDDDDNDNDDGDDYKH
ncbi:MAG: hypothetical protein Q9166_003571 [cf. Caloplaca sp. 2 TL-2023]